jgi:spermidine/putrescine transport system permease protein
MAVFIVVPILLVIYYGFTAETETGITLTLEHFRRVFERTGGAGLRSMPYVFVVARSVSVAAASTALCLLAGYPVAYILSSREYVNRTVLMFLFAVPMWMNDVLRTYGWLTILEDNGALNALLSALGLPRGSYLYTDGAVVLGMVYNFLPFMILPIYTVLKKLDHSIVEAAQDLGGNPLKVFARVVFPLSLPGVVSGVTMVFMPAVTTFFISNVLGGSDYLLIGNLIERQFLQSDNWNFGSAISIVLMVIILISMAVFSLVDKDNEGGVIV